MSNLLRGIGIQTLLAIFTALITIICIDASNAQKKASKDYVTITNLPAWVSDIDIPPAVESRMDQYRGGISYLLSSRQFYYHNSTRTRYARVARQVINREGLERAAKIDIDFRPDTDQVFFHRLIIRRGEEKIDLLDKVQFHIFQRENNLEKGILDGQLTVFVNLPDVRVGDIIEYAYSKKYQTILMADDFFTRFRNSYNIPVTLLERRVIVPKQLKLNIKYSRNRYEPTVSTSEDKTSYTWLINDPDPVHQDKKRPKWYDANSWMFISSINSWASVAENSVPHFSPVESLPPHFDAKIKEIGERSSNLKRRVADVLALVQNEIRYVGIEIGRGAFIPRPPSLVISRGYGDCKDKAYVMVSALRKLGIEAVPVLAHLSLGESLQDKLPSPYAFNHVIVRVSNKGKTYWLDPTGTQQYSPDPSVSQSNYGYVLPISRDSNDLEFIEPKKPLRPETRIDETIELNYSDDQPPLTLSVLSSYRGNDADDFRRKLAVSGQNKLASDYLEYYRNTYSGLEVKKKMEVIDDLQMNTIRVNEKYQVPADHDREELFKEMVLKGDGVRSILEAVDNDERSSPIWLNYPVYRIHTTEIVNLIGPVTALDGVRISKPYLSFFLNSQSDEDSLKVEWLITTKRNHVLPEETAEYRKIYDQIRSKTDWYYDVRKSSLLTEPSIFDKMDEMPDWVWALIVIVPFLLFIFFATKWGLRADSEYEASAHYFPVNTWKMIIMTTVTFGLYPMFWFWKHWRWIKEHKNLDIWPWLRMLFYPLWSYSAFVFANRDENNNRPLANWFGPFVIVAAVLDATLTGINFSISDSWPFNWQMALYFASLVAILSQVLPAVQTVNRLNQDEEDGRAAMNKNSRYNIWNIAAMVFFPFFYWLMYWNESEY